MNESCLNQRLESLKLEWEKGRQHLQCLEQEEWKVRETLLRISGAIQVLEELSSPPDSVSAPDHNRPPTLENADEPEPARAYG